MVARGYTRGHLIIYQDNQWVYEDDRTSADIERPCVRCGKMATSEGYDACLGYLSGVKSACCGHGVEELMIERDDK